MVTKAKAVEDPDLVNFHGQSTFIWQGYPSIRSPYEGSKPSRGGQGARQRMQHSIAGLRLWKGAEFWVNPELDQGFGIGDTHGAPDYRAAKLTSSAQTIPMPACSVISSARPSISAARRRNWTPTSTSSPER